jgi:hypothetical protein
MAFNANNPNGQATMANSAPVTIASDQSALPVSGTLGISGLSSGGNTLAVGTSGNILVSGTSAVGIAPSLNPVSVSGVDGSGLKRHFLLNTDGSLKVDGSAVTQPISGSVTATISGTPSVTISGTPNVAVTSSVLPTGAALESGGNLASINAKTPSLGQTTMSASQPVTIASDQSLLSVLLTDSYVTGQSAQTALVNNILTAASGTAATDLAGYHSALIQVVSTGTAGAFIFEGSNDNVSFVTVPVYNQLLTTGVPIVAAITATASQIGYILPVNFRYLRLRISTAITGGSIQAFSKFMQTPFTAAVTQVANNTAASLLTTATIASGTVTTVSTVSSVTSAQTAIPGAIADVASAAITTTTTTATLTPTFGATYKVSIPVTVVSGTSPTLDIQVQESSDSGTNWYAVYDFPRITATGFYQSPTLPLTGNRVRYVQTVSGTTPSFTRAINRLQSSWTNADRVRQQIDRSIVLTTLNSVTPSLYVAGTTGCQLQISLGAATTAPILQLEGSETGVSTEFFAIGSTLTGVANSTVNLFVSNIQTNFIRARVSTAGVTVTPNFVLIKGF